MDKHPVYNMHTHIFNFDCVPNGFLSNYVPRLLSRVLASLLRRPASARIVNVLLRRFTMLRKYATFVALGTKRSPLEVYEEMIKAYQNEDARFIVLPMNFDYMGGGEAPANNVTQLELMLRVRAQYPDRCLPFLSVDPRQGNADEILDYVKKYIGPPNYQFVGIKLYPALGFYPSDQRLEKMYQYAEAHLFPVLTHCTRVGAYYAGKKLPEDLARYNTFHESQAVKERHKTAMYTNVNLHKPSEACDNFLDPVNYIDVLEKFPNLKICFAHFGGETEMAKVFDKAGNQKPEQPLLHRDAVNAGLSAGVSWFRIIEYLMKSPLYPNVYADVSFTLHENELYEALKSVLGNTAYRNRILFGTDFFMATQYKTEFNLYDEFRTAVNDPAVWKEISYLNPVRFLESDFYVPADKPGES